ncbi:MAG: UvrD family DEAD/DEAH box helicase [Acholeplasma sp.]
MILNKEQQAAVYTDDKNIFLIAGAGSGKTRVIVERIKYLITKGVCSSDILCITFTNKSADEMRHRLKDFDVYVNTFHGYCYNVLSQHKTFKIFEHNNEFTDDEILKVARYKNSLKTNKKPKVYERYAHYLDSRELLDFDDLMLDAFEYMHAHTFKYIFVDEFQDTNLLQYKILSLMMHQTTHLFAVGDPDQSIYAFRGARVELIERYLKDYDATLLKLQMNYRSNMHILKASNNLIDKNLNRYKKRLIGVKSDTNKPMIYIGHTSALYQQIIYLIKSNKDFDAVILYRNHYQVTYLRQLLIRNYLFDVRLYSFHESKGLEFRAVYIVGLESLPFDKTNMYKNKEEERRLLFVGMTRAMDKLYLFSTKKTAFLRQTKVKIEYL